VEEQKSVMSSGSFNSAGFKIVHNPELKQKKKNQFA
jgi:hypothetical protein